MHQLLHDNRVQHGSQTDQGLGKAHPQHPVLDEVMVEGRITGGHHQSEGESLDQAEGYKQVKRGGGEQLKSGAHEVQNAPRDAHLAHSESLE